MRTPGEKTAGMLALFVRHPNAANLLMILMVMFGIWGTIQLNRQLMPTIEVGNVQISVVWAGASAEDIQSNILVAIEPAVRYLDDVTGMSSTAREGRGSISLDFERDTDMQDAERQIEAAVAAITNLPEGADDPVITVPKFFDPVASIGLSGPFPEQTLRFYAREVRDGLLAAGVDKVTLTGYRAHEIVVKVDDARLHQLDLTVADLALALSPNVTDRPSGSLPGDFDAQIRAVAPDVSAKNIAAAEIKSSASGDVLILADIATVTEGFDEDEALGFMRGEPAIKLTVSRSAAADTILTYEKVLAYVNGVAPTLPASLNIQVFNAAAELVNDRLSLLVNNGLTGLVIVLAILFIFLDARIAVWVAMGIPIAILATLGLMQITGQTINMISMFALMMMLGIIVDDAIVVGEHTATRYGAGDSRARAAITGAKRMAIPVVAASLTTMVAFGPILLLGGVVGQVMAALPLVTLAVLVASLVECFLVLPGHLAHSLPPVRKKPAWFRRNFDAGFAFFRENIFGWLSDMSFRWRYATIAVAVAAAIVGGALIPSGKLDFEFFPTAEGESFNIFASFQPGTPQDEMRAIIVDIEAAVSAAEAELAPEGEALIQTTYANLDLENGGASFDVFLTSSEVRTVRTSVITQAIRDALPRVAGVERIGVREMRGGPQGRAIDVQFSGGDVAVLKRASEALQDVLEGFDGVTSVSDTLRYGSPELTMVLTARGEALGFNLENLGAQIRDAFEGRTVAIIAAQDEEITIRIERRTAGEGSAALRDLWVRSPAGTYVPLSGLVTFSERQGFDRIMRVEGKTTVSVRADTEEGVTTGAEVLARLGTDYLPEIAALHDVDYDLEGTQAEQNEAFADLQLGAILALAMMYVIIAWIFGSYFMPFSVMLIIPFGVVGALWGHLVMGYDLTIISLMGLLGLAGILVNDSIVLVTRMQERLDLGEGLRAAATGAARDRLRAVLLTSMTTIGGLTPLLFEKSLQAQFLIPMAITIIFGLGLATLLVLFLVPALIAVGTDIGAFVRWVLMTPKAPTFRQLWAAGHLDAPVTRPAG